MAAGRPSNQDGLAWAKEPEKGRTQSALTRSVSRAPIWSGCWDMATHLNHSLLLAEASADIRRHGRNAG